MCEAHHILEINFRVDDFAIYDRLHGRNNEIASQLAHYRGYTHSNIVHLQCEMKWIATRLLMMSSSWGISNWVPIHFTLKRAVRCALFYNIFTIRYKSKFNLLKTYSISYTKGNFWKISCLNFTLKCQYSIKIRKNVIWSLNVICFRDNIARVFFLKPYILAQYNKNVFEIPFLRILPKWRCFVILPIFVLVFYAPVTAILYL